MTWRELYLLATGNHDAIDGLVIRGKRAALESGDPDLQLAVAAINTQPNVLFRVLDEHAVPVPAEVLQALRKDR